MAVAERVLAAATTFMEPASSSDNITKRDCVFVVNPKGANGRTGREWKKIYPSLSAELSKHWNVREVFTAGPSHATDIAKKAVHDGAAAVVAVGGDGTLHEVVNGFFENGNLVGPKELGGTSTTALGLIPLGTGSDFARTFGWKTDPYQAIERLARGKQQKIDVGQLVVGDGHVQRSFINVGDVHLSARAGYYAGKYKWLGNLCYVVGALQGFMHHTNCDLDIRINGGEWRRFAKVTSIAVGNAKYFGGGMKIAPTADPISRDLEVIILQDFKWYHFLFHLFKLYTGSHTTLKNVCHERVQSIEIKETVANTDNVKHDDIFVQADGEHLGFLPVSFAILPATLNLIS